MNNRHAKAALVAAMLSQGVLPVFNYEPASEPKPVKPKDTPVASRITKPHQGAREMARRRRQMARARGES